MKENLSNPNQNTTIKKLQFFGYVEEYNRGDQVTIIIVYPDKSQEEMGVFASKKGDIYTLLHVTHDSQVGMHQIILQYGGANIATTTFQILENQ